METSILRYRASEPQLKEVLDRLAAARLPLIYRYEEGVACFYYTGVCDGNTAHYLEQIIKGYIGLFKQ